MKVTESGKLLRVFIGESDRYHSELVYDIIVLKARELGLAGTSVIKGIEGFGATSHIHSAKLLRLTEQLPIIIEIVDVEKKIHLIREEIDKIFEESGCGGMMTLETVEIIKYAPIK